MAWNRGGNSSKRRKKRRKGKKVEKKEKSEKNEKRRGKKEEKKRKKGKTRKKSKKKRNKRKRKNETRKKGKTMEKREKKGNMGKKKKKVLKRRKMDKKCERDRRRETERGHAEGRREGGRKERKGRTEKGKEEGERKRGDEMRWVPCRPSLSVHTPIRNETETKRQGNLPLHHVIRGVASVPSRKICPHQTLPNSNKHHTQPHFLSRLPIRKSLLPEFNPSNFTIAFSTFTGSHFHFCRLLTFWSSPSLSVNGHNIERSYLFTLDAVLWGQGRIQTRPLVLHAISSATEKSSRSRCRSLHQLMKIPQAMIQVSLSLVKRSGQRAMVIFSYGWVGPWPVPLLFRASAAFFDKISTWSTVKPLVRVPVGCLKALVKMLPTAPAPSPYSLWSAKLWRVPPTLFCKSYESCSSFHPGCTVVPKFVLSV